MNAELHSVHRQAADWLIRLRESPDDQDAAELFESWLDESPAHVRAWASITDIFEAVGQTRPEFEAHWRRATGGPLEAAPRKRHPWARVRAPQRAAYFSGAIAAALAVVLLTPSLMLRFQSDHITGAGEIERVTLADGSSVHLGPESAIAVKYEGSARSIELLAGQAWFDVKHNPGAPFRVAAGDVTTTVLGTSFDVRQIGSSTAVSVRNGRVRVVDHGARPALTQELTAGKWTRLDASHRVMNGSTNPELLGAWRDGKLVIRDERISDAINELRPWYKGRIVLLSTTLGQERIDGVIDTKDPASALTAIVGQQGGSVTQITPWFLIVS